MEPSLFIFIGIVVFVLQIFILKWVVKSSINETLLKQSKQQVILLAKLAQKQGVPDDEINRILNTK